MKDDVPKTMTELRMRLAEDDRKQLLTWLTTGQNVEGREVRIYLSQWNAGQVGSFICEIKRWEPKNEV